MMQARSHQRKCGLMPWRNRNRGTIPSRSRGPQTRRTGQLNLNNSNKIRTPLARADVAGVAFEWSFSSDSSPYLARDKCSFCRYRGGRAWIELYMRADLRPLHIWGRRYIATSRLQPKCLIRYSAAGSTPRPAALRRPRDLPSAAYAASPTGPCTRTRSRRTRPPRTSSYPHTRQRARTPSR